MTTLLTPATITRFEKVAVDNGFDQELPRQGDWLNFASTQAPLRLWLSTAGDGVFIAALSQPQVARALAEGLPTTAPLPPGAAAGRVVCDIPALHRLVRRAFQLSKTLPDELLHVFERQIATLQRKTEVERLIIQRVGQDVFRNGLLEYWDGRCAITGLDVAELLRASHIKPWAKCVTDAERLDIFNGLLLAPQLDAAFDKGYITVQDDGTVLVSDELQPARRRLLGLDGPLRASVLADGHRAYLAWHRSHLFKNTAGDEALQAFAQQVLNQRRLDLVLSGPYRWGAPDAPRVNTCELGDWPPIEHRVFFLGAERMPVALKSSTIVLIDRRGPRLVMVGSAGNEG